MSRTRLGRGLIAAILIATPSLQARQQPPAQPAPSTSQIRGTVRSGPDDAPIARARVMATADVLPEPRVTLSGADGKYALADLPAGSYIVSVTRTGYAPQTWGQARSLTGTPTIGYSTLSLTPSPSESTFEYCVPMTHSNPSGSPSPSVSVAG